MIGLYCKQISGLLVDDKYKRTLSMINFDEFEVATLCKGFLPQDHQQQPSENASQDHQLTPFQTPNSIHDTAIQQIQDHYSSIQHSANILDRIDRCEAVFGLQGEFEVQEKQNSQDCKLRMRMERRLKNQTKNIPKNFGKGIISFIQKNDQKVRALLTKNGVNYPDFLQRVRVQKRIINTIADLRRLWTDPLIGKSMRIISNVFFRGHALNYIFNSRISNYSSHVKYRQSLWQALRNPQNFNRIKQY